MMHALEMILLYASIAAIFVLPFVACWAAGVFRQEDHDGL